MIVNEILRYLNTYLMVKCHFNIDVLNLKILINVETFILIIKLTFRF